MRYMHHHRDIGVLKHVAGNPFENTLAKTGMRVSAHDKKIAAEFVSATSSSPGLLQQPC